MNEFQAIMFMLVVFVFAIIGFAYTVKKLLDKIDYYKQPRIKPTKETQELMVKLEKKIEDLGLEERAFLINLLLGSCDIHLRVQKEGINIVGAYGLMEETEQQKLKDYTG